MGIGKKKVVVGECMVYWTNILVTVFFSIPIAFQGQLKIL
jgi:hypothetical protein